ncbi:MAG: zinc ribbon domain-containing protein, partial [Chloroflexi bacterium]|nr:zinc ribbon domain-containing protein [Chloroflexota bacterium]
ALLQSIEETPVCPGCGRRVKGNWIICPNCHTKLKKTCHQCGKLMDLPWNLCPYCGTPTPGMRRENLSLEDALQPLAPTPSDDEEIETETTGEE